MESQLVFGHYDRNANENGYLEIIRNMIKEYQGKYPIFEDETKIYEKICFFMTQVYNDNLMVLYKNDAFAFALVISTFFGKPFCLLQSPNSSDTYTVNYLMITKVKYPLHTCLLLCYVSRTMQSMMEKRRDYEMVENFEKLGQKWEESAVKIIKKLHEADPTYAITALQIDYRQMLREQKSNTETANTATGCNLNCFTYSDYIDAKHNQSRELMSIAYYGKAMEFLSQNACRRVIDERRNAWQRVKLVVNFVFRMIYLILLAILLIYGNPINGKNRRPDDIILRWCWYYILLFIISQFFTSFIKIIDKVVVYGKEVSQESKFFFGKEFSKDKMKQAFSLVNRYLTQNKLSVFRITLFANILLFEAFRLVNSSLSRGKVANGDDGFSDIFIPLLSDLLYCFLFAVSAITSLRYFQTTSIGFFLHILQRMFKTVRMFSLLFLFFWLILSIVCTRLTNALQNSNNTWIYELQRVGKFEIFGEIDDAQKTGISNECEKYENSSFSRLHKMNFDEASCFIGAILIPYLFFAYMFISGILLINLLTAQLTKEYEDLCDRSKYYKDYIKYEYTSKLDSKMILPPPLSIIYVMARCCSCCCVFKFVKRLDGVEFGANRPVPLVDVQETCDIVKRIVETDNHQMWNALQAKISELSTKYSVRLDNLETFKTELINVIDKCGVEMRKGTRMEEPITDGIRRHSVQHESSGAPLSETYRARSQGTPTFFTASETTPFLSRNVSSNSNGRSVSLSNSVGTPGVSDDEKEIPDV